MTNSFPVQPFQVVSLFFLFFYILPLIKIHSVSFVFKLMAATCPLFSDSQTNFTGPIWKSWLPLSEQRGFFCDPDEQLGPLER